MVCMVILAQAPVCGGSSLRAGIAGWVCGNLGKALRKAKTLE